MCYFLPLRFLVYVTVNKFIELHIKISKHFYTYNISTLTAWLNFSLTLIANEVYNLWSDKKQILLLHFMYIKYIVDRSTTYVHLLCLPCTVHNCTWNQRYNARKVNCSQGCNVRKVYCSLVYSAYILKPVLSGRNL